MPPSTSRTTGICSPALSFTPSFALSFTPSLCPHGGDGLRSGGGLGPSGARGRTAVGRIEHAPDEGLR
ncbi:hypothetical protein GCM10010272_45000 [Streptomyces lateritius]|nr:hypothetical protein GCM10010272_45000 [Streptomyces lateritius]